MNVETHVAIHFFSEGKTDLGEGVELDTATTGVVPILVRTLCGKPDGMRVRRRRYAHLEGKGLWQKVRFAKWQARGSSAAAVFVVDSEGDVTVMKKELAELERGRDASGASLPMAVGVAQPCIEAWLLADPSAIRRGLHLANQPNTPDEPEMLPAPCDNPDNNPKTALAAACGSPKGDLAARQKWAITAAMDDMAAVRNRCPQGFDPFADEVEEHIRPLF